MAKTKTAVIERVHIYGTPHYMLYVSYRGETLAWVGKSPISGMARVEFAQVPENRTMTDRFRVRTAEDVRQCEDLARKHGFTHVRFAGDWWQRPKPPGGAL